MSVVPFFKQSVARRAHLSLIILVPLLLCADRAFPWSQQGHVIIAQAAQTMLSNNVLKKVQSILNTNEMSSVALWADQVRQLMQFKSGPLVGNAEAQQFIIDHPDNDKWHFVNLPLNTFKYLYNGRFADPNDIVHVLTNCIAVLEGDSTFMTKPQALRVLIHMVGDIHQPLHVACGYYVPNGTGATLLKDPGDILNVEAHDRGGNSLRINGSENSKLHGFWDDNLVQGVDTTPGNKKMLQIITNAVDTVNWKNSGSRYTWPAKWAKDAVLEAQMAYDGVTFGPASFKANGEVNHIHITLAGTYANDRRDQVTRQLAKAAFHLARLLNRIEWD